MLPFENLTGDASLDWIKPAGTMIMNEQLLGSPNLELLRANAVRDAESSGATKIMHGTITRRGTRFHVEARMEDAKTHKIDAALVSDGSLLQALSALSAKISPGQREFSTTNEEAAAAWGRGDFEKATTLDPDFGTAWTSWTATLTSAGKAQDAAAIAKRGLARTSLRSNLTKAQLELAYTGLIKDMPGRRAALAQLIKINPNDVATIFAAAEAEGFAHNFPAAAILYRQVLAKHPNNGAALNGLGYAEGEAGNLPVAEQSLKAYGKLPNQAVNSLDSLGEIHFMNGKFKEAREYFEQAAARDPKFLNGATIFKAAHAQWLAGDLPGADNTMRRFLDEKKNAGDRALAWREATWLFTTGRTAEAINRLSDPPVDQKDFFNRQRMIWRGEVKIPEDLTELQKLYETTAPAADGLSRVIYAKALVKAGKSDQAEELLKRFPLPDSAGDPLLQSLVLPQFLALRRELNIQ